VTWRVVAASEVGTSHVANGTPCEDSCWVQVDSTAAGVPVLSVFVADGAGTAARGGEGAELAIQAAAAFVAAKLAVAEFGVADGLAVDCVSAVRARIYAEAEKAGLSARDYACTFLGVVSTPQASLAMQIGDGGIVVDAGSGLELAVAPMSGEYANMTNFVTEDDAITVMATKVFPGPLLRVAAFSDGLQRLALNMAANTPHEPFFAPFFRVLGTSPVAKEDELQSALVRFLSSTAVNERTDDDKTLALAVQAV
jgi:Protein phosphatase 2C